MQLFFVTEKIFHNWHKLITYSRRWQRINLQHTIRFTIFGHQWNYSCNPSPTSNSFLVQVVF